MPRPPHSASPIRHTADPATTRDELARLRPELVGRYDAELPGARAAVLGRLLGALGREPLPGLIGRRGEEVSFPGVTVRYPRGAAVAFAPGEEGLAATVRTDSVPEDEWAGLGANGWEWGGASGGQGGPLPGGAGGAWAAGGSAEAGWPGNAGSGAGRPGDAGSAGAGWTAGGRAGEGWQDSDAWVGVGESSPGAFIGDPGTLVRVLWPGSDLAAEVDNSVANMALARAGRREGALPAAGDPDGLARIEQSLTDGHPLHPCCRTRGGMSVADVLAYAPEHSPRVRLRRFRVPPERWHGTAEPVLIAHPWQAERIRERYPWLVDDGETGPALPLMSLRTLAMAGGGPHVKTAVDVQMTSAVRTVSPAAVENGPVLSRLLKAVTKDLPIEILEETAAGAVLVDGRPQRHLAYLVREAPRLAPGEVVVPIAIYGTDRFLRTVPEPYEIMVLLGRVLFGPLARVLERGVALEAHGQNTLVVLRDGLPVRIVYRDLGGVRVSGRRLDRAGFAAPRLLGDLPSDDPQVLRTKLAAAALGTVAAEIIAGLSRHGADPQRLWGIVAAALRETGTTDVRHLLREPLPVKATTAMRLAADPLDDIWAYLDNPLAAHL